MVRSRGIRAVLAVAGATAILTASAPASAAPAPVSIQWHLGFGFGTNQCGQLGNGGTSATSTPVPVSLPAKVQQVAAGVDVSAALLSDGTVWTWGDPFDGAVGTGAASGIQYGFNCQVTPQQVPGLPWITQIAVSPFSANMYAVGLDGSVWVWGSDASGATGLGFECGACFENTPQQITGLTGITQVSAGWYYALALRSDGTVWAWGSNYRGDLGDGTTADHHSTPEQVPGLTGISQVAASADASYAVRSDGTLFAWGDNSFGQLGNGTTCDCFVNAPQPVPGLTGVTQVASDGDSTLAVAGAGGNLWAWGDNSCGQLGDGTTTSTPSPELVSTTGVIQVAMGNQFQPITPTTSTSEHYSGAVLANGTLLTWGCNGYGQLGNGTSGAPVLTPTPVSTLTTVSQISFGSAFNTGIASAYGLAVDAMASVPGLAGDTQAQASQAIQAAGLVLGTVSTVVDRSCNNIGTVMNQSPAAGTFVSYGTPVSITIGKRPPRPFVCP
jgi:alpha-tubulin suppressor-like RCC1 family protein